MSFKDTADDADADATVQTRVDWQPEDSTADRRSVVSGRRPYISGRRHICRCYEYDHCQRRLLVCFRGELATYGNSMRLHHAPPDSLLQMDDEDNVMDELKAVPVESISDGMAGEAVAGNSANLCIQVRDTDDPDAVEIPEVVDPYTVTTTYEVGTTDAAFKPIGKTSNLGRIDRDGTTVRIPYLTTNDRYHQRIVILNRGGMAEYRMSFMDEEGKMATSGMDALGVLAAKKTTVLSLRDDDVVMIEGGTRTSGTSHHRSPSKAISVWLLSCTTGVPVIPTRWC